MTDIVDRLYKLMLRPGFQMRSEQETLYEGKKEIERLRADVKALAEAPYIAAEKVRYEERQAKLFEANAQMREDFVKIARACKLYDIDEIDGHEAMATIEYVLDQQVKV